MTGSAESRAPTGVCVVRVEPRDGQGVLISITTDGDIEARETPRKSWHGTQIGPAMSIVEAFLLAAADTHGGRRRLARHRGPT